MKNYKIKALIAFAAVSMGAGIVADAATVTYSEGDLLMGFRATSGQGAGTSYVVDIGSAADFRDVNVYGTVTIDGDFTADLAAIYGANWQSRTDLMWGIVGTPSNIATVAGDPAATMYASKAQSAYNVPGTGWSIAGSSTRTAVSTIITGFQDGFAGDQASANSAVAAIQDEASDPYDWRSYLASGGDASRTTGNKDFSGFADIEANTGTSVSLFRVAGAGAGSFEGTFSLSSSGLTFVPEPTSSALTALGALALVFRRRRSA